MRDGERIEGTVIAITDEEYVVRWGAGKSTLSRKVPRGSVVSVRLAPPDVMRLRELARRAEADRDFADAAAIWTQVCALRPDSPDDQLRRARALRDAGRFDDAAPAFRCALTLRPDDPKPWLELAETQLSATRPREAAQSALEYLRRATSGLDEASWLLGRAFEADNRPDDALESYEQALARNPRHGGAMERQVELLLRKRSFTEAEAAARRFLKIAPDSRSGPVALGKTYYRQGRYPAAVEAFKVAAALGGPGYERARTFLTVARARMDGRDPLKDLGESLLATALELDPDLRRE